MECARNPEDRWAWVEISQGALRRNTQAIKKTLARGCQLMAVVKADAYGHGAAACAKIFLGSGAEQLAVATVAEGVELRRAGITAPILVLSEPPITSIPQLVEHHLMPSVATVDFALALGEAAAAANTVAYYHLIIDTGMTRAGVSRSDVLELRRAIDFHRGLECAGTFTHLATADALDDWDLSLQVNRFCEAATALHEAGLETGLVHCSNTPATLLHPDLHMDMARVGIGLYGLHPADATRPRIELEPAMSVRGRVTRVVYPAVGDGVSYGMTYRVPKRNVQVATVPMGYADGLSRGLSNRMDVLVDGIRHRQVGAICMDQFMFAVEVNTTRAFRPTVPVAEGDVVTVMGTDGDDCVTADDIAALRDTITYEVTCDFGRRLPRVYV